ncbi:MAG: nucleoside deaminase [Bacteroidetes bacterium]|nr:nucleoside deaminase [Bacteroidota bacterium]
MRRTVITVVCTLLAVVLLQLALYSGWMVFGGSRPLKPAERALLIREGDSAIAHREVPVAAIVFYGDSMIGVGHNTVQQDSNIAGHAEINAINDAIRHLGYERFMRLRRDSLRVITTFEPCLMCRGALLEYGIRHVEFLKGKSPWFWLREDLRTAAYQWKRTQRDNGGLQDSLFDGYHRRWPTTNP